jgi:catecholate siderophore receptor
MPRNTRHSAPELRQANSQGKLGLAISTALQALVGVAALASSTAFAQTPSSIEEIQITGEAGYGAKQTLTATKTDTPLLDVPQSIAIVTESQIRDRSAQGLAEALRYVPGINFAQGEGNRETPIMRGISTTSDFFVDGVRDDVQYYRDLYNIERAEVFRGPNAMIFGRGATGGLINRVTKSAHWDDAAIGTAVTLGSFDNRRATVDVNQPINDTVAVRVNGLFEDSGSFRDGVELQRKGIAPTVSFKAGQNTLITTGYEHFEDDRIADRGVSSFQGRPLDVDPSTFFGNASASPTGSTLDSFTAFIEHAFSNGVTLRNHTRYSDQDKFYQNVFPGAVSADGTMVALSAYSNATTRESLFNQTDLTFKFNTGTFAHTFLTGVELGKQDTANFRNTGFFSGNATSISVPLSNPTTTLVPTFRQSATDADNAGTAEVKGIYVQDQIELTEQLQLIAGLRYDDFEVDFHNNRNGDQIKSTDEFLSPRIGLVFKPMEQMSLYANYSIAYQPRAGEQLSSLSLTNAALDPEKFKNYEVGFKWDISPSLSTSVAVYRLDRTNVVVLDPTDPTNTRTILSDGQRSEGVEIDVVGNITPQWSISGGYAYSDAKFVADTSATLREGARVAQIPKHTFSLWNRYNVSDMWGAGLGVIHRTEILAANELIPTAAAPIPNVMLPSYTRVDAALFYNVSDNVQAQLNVENLLDEEYFASANSNNNISPGSPRAVRVSLNARF